MTNNKIYPLIVLILLLVLSPISLSAQSIDDQRCTSSFTQFAYEGPPTERISRAIIFDSSWEAVLSLTHLSELDGSHSLYRTELSRSVNGLSEIWISLSDGKRYYYPSQSIDGREGFGIYSPTSDSFEIVSNHVNNTELYVVNLYATSDGTVWGQVYWDNLAEYPEIARVPVLSKFNENTRRFEFAEGVLEIPLLQGQNHFNYTHIVVDRHDNFWIFGDDENIYQYNPVSHVTNQIGSSPGEVRYTVLSDDGDIYFNINKWNSDLTIPEASLFRFDTETSAVSVVDVPHDSNWPDYAGLLVDEMGRLWLGAIGYRDVDSTWNLIHPPYLKTYSDHLGQYMWNAPEILLESADGRLWYRKYLDSGLWAEGIAWFDPESLEGCVVTNVPTAIVEDLELNLWIVVDGILYSDSPNQ